MSKKKRTNTVEKVKILTVPLEGSSSETQGPTELTQQQKANMVEVLQNPLVLNLIMNSLDFPELKTCRKVSKKWRNISSQILLQRESCVLEFQYNFSEDKFLRSGIPIKINEDKNRPGPSRKKVVKSLDLEALNIILAKSINFPCSNFIFKEISHLKETQLLTFFISNGHLIKTLSLCGSRHCNPVAVNLSEILCHLTPNLENLDLTYFWNFKWTGKNDPEISLASLKTFTWRNCSYAPTKILESSSFLKSIPWIDPQDTHSQVLQDTDNIHLIETLDSLTWKESQLQRLSTLNPRLKSLEYLMGSQFTFQRLNIIQKIIQESRDTLKNLVITIASSTTHGIVLPRLSKLKTIQILDFTSNCDGPLFAKGINLDFVFPNLKILDVVGLHQMLRDDGWKYLFPPPNAYTGSLLNVTTIKIDSGCAEINMHRLGNLCPFFNSVIISCLDNGISGLTRIFKLWTRLESIEVVLEGWKNHVYFMDSVITGMNKRNCETLRGLRGHEVVMNLEELVTLPSIQNLKDLKLFKIKLISKPSLPFSRVSGLYGFKLISDLKVIVQFDHQELSKNVLDSFLDELGPFANIRHKKYSPLEIQ